MDDIEVTAEIGIYNLNNPYGYLLNVNNARINDLYYRFKEWKNIPRHIPLTDSERREFENFIFDNLKK